MKKSLIALAAVAATGAAMAQSTVTLYGVADVGIGSSQSYGDASRVKGAYANSGINNASSRIGFRGTEDLGNGLKANFQFEQRVNLANGSTDTNTFARQAWVGLSGDFGAISAGRQFRPSHDAVVYDIVNTANYSINDQLFGYDGGTRQDAQLKYVTPSMEGFKVSVGYVFKDNVGGSSSTVNGVTTEQKSKNGTFDLGLIYENGPLAAGFGFNYDKTEYSITGADVSESDSKSAKNAHLGASYDFDSFKLAGSLHRNDSKDLRGATIGVSVPFGAFSLAADVGYAKQRRATFSDKKESATNAVIEAKYALSKRTQVYGVYYFAGNEKARTVAQNYGVKNNYGIGLRHNF